MENNPEKYISPKANTEFDVTGAKILIGDFLARSDDRYTADELGEILTVNENVIDYFVYVRAYDELEQDGIVVVDENGFAALSEKGRGLVAELEKLVPKSLRDKALMSGERYKREKKSSEDTRVYLEENGERTAAVCECFDNGRTLMRIKLWNDEKELAEHERSMMNADPVKLYCKVLDLVLGNFSGEEVTLTGTPLEITLGEAVQKYVRSCGKAENICSVDSQGEVRAVCRCTAGEKLVMELEVNAPDETQADYLCGKMAENTALFSQVTNAVLSNRN